MGDELNNTLQMIVQRLRADELFGVASVPIVLPPRPRTSRTAPNSTLRNPGLISGRPQPAESASETPNRMVPDAAQPSQIQQSDRDIDRPPLQSTCINAFHPQKFRDAESSHRKQAQLAALDHDQVRGCRKCDLCNTRTNTVFGQGDPDARIIFVGEAPGFDEDKQGLAFVGMAGQLLTKMIAAMGLSREEVFICNVLKCRPPGNRTPAAEEIMQCSPYLREQLRVISPEVIVALGAPAAKTLLNTTEPIGKIRGKFYRYYFSGVPNEGPWVPCMPTYHPAYLLRDETEKKKAWADLKQVMALLAESATRGAASKPA